MSHDYRDTEITISPNPSLQPKSDGSPHPPEEIDGGPRREEPLMLLPFQGLTQESHETRRGNDQHLPRQGWRVRGVNRQTGRQWVGEELKRVHASKPLPTVSDGCSPPLLTASIRIRLQPFETHTMTILAPLLSSPSLPSPLFSPHPFSPSPPPPVNLPLGTNCLGVCQPPF